MVMALPGNHKPDLTKNITAELASQKRQPERLSGLTDKINAFLLVKAENVPSATKVSGFGNPPENVHLEASLHKSILIVLRINSYMVILTEGLLSSCFSCY